MGSLRRASWLPAEHHRASLPVHYKLGNASIHERMAILQDATDGEDFCNVEATT